MSIGRDKEDKSDAVNSEEALPDGQELEARERAASDYSVSDESALRIANTDHEVVCAAVLADIRKGIMQQERLASLSKSGAITVFGKTLGATSVTVDKVTYNLSDSLAKIISALQTSAGRDPVEVLKGIQKLSEDAIVKHVKKHHGENVVMKAQSILGNSTVPIPHQVYAALYLISTDALAGSKDVKQRFDTVFAGGVGVTPKHEK